MATLSAIKHRIDSVKNINQVTSALEAVSASKMRKSQNAVLASRIYAQHAYNVLATVAAQSKGTPQHPLLEVRPDEKNIMIVLISSDRGLAGAYSANITRRAIRFAEQYKRPVRWVTVGRKGRDTIRRWIARQKSADNAPAYLKQQEIVATFSNLPTNPGLSDITEITHVLFDEFLDGQVDRVFLAYTYFASTMKQVTSVLPLLPLQPVRASDDSSEDDPRKRIGKRAFIFEPDETAILNEIIPRFTQLQILQAIRESLSSEHSARMVAMHNASENAETLAEALQLDYNNARQLSITGEILDIIGGVEALKRDDD